MLSETDVVSKTFTIHNVNPVKVCIYMYSIYTVYICVHIHVQYIYIYCIYMCAYTCTVYVYTYMSVLACVQSSKEIRHFQTLVMSTQFDRTSFVSYTCRDGVGLG